MNTNNILLGDVFIIPNGSIRLGDCWDKENIINFFKEIFGGDYEVNENEHVIQCWFTDRNYEELKSNHMPTSENWANHGHPLLGIDPGEWVEVMPLSKLKGLKEGDTLDIKFHGFDISLRATQLQYRYRRFGKFEDVVALYPR
jgi:hypothetical protein